MEKGICFECGKPLANQNSYGYHRECVEIVYNRERENIISKN